MNFHLLLKMIKLQRMHLVLENMKKNLFHRNYNNNKNSSCRSNNNTQMTLYLRDNKKKKQLSIIQLSKNSFLLEYLTTLHVLKACKSDKINKLKLQRIIIFTMNQHQILQTSTTTTIVVVGINQLKNQLDI